MYNEVVEECHQALGTSSQSHFAARQYLEMHREIQSRCNPTVLELGVDSGRGSKIFLNAVHSVGGGHLVSVDIADCSTVAQSSYWQFIQSDSADIQNVLKSAPVLQKGIDVLYVDSLHTVEHVHKELFGFYPFIKKNGVIFFDDIESFPYMENQRKDNIHTEIGNRLIRELVNKVYEANMDQLELTIFRGSTGLARYDKRSEMGVQLNLPSPVPERHNKRLWRLKKSVQKRTPWVSGR